MANDNDFDPSSQNYGWFDGAYNNAGWNPASKPAYGAPGGPNPWVRDTQPLFLSGAWGSDPSGTINARSSGMFNSMGDSLANVWQQIGTPVAAYMLAAKARKSVNWMMPQFLQQRPMQGYQAAAWRAFGSAAPTWGPWSATGYRMGQLAGGLGGGAIGGLSRGMVGFGGFAEGAAVGSRVVGALGGAAGGLFGALLGPEAVMGMALMQGAQSAVFDPYINRRRMSQAAMTGYANSTIEGEGSARYGTGFNNVAAYGIASKLQTRAWSDMSMSNNDRAQIAGLSMGNDLMPGMAGGASPAAVSKRLDAIVSSTKQTMRVLKMSEDKLREVNALIKQFSDAGVGSGGGLNRLMSNIGVASKATGFDSVGMMQNEVQRFGGQAQSAGMLFESGALSGTDAMARMGALRRRGGISEAMLGLYGGVSGMGSLATNAAITGVSTEYAGIQQFNRYIGGRAVSGLGANLGAFSSAVGANPIAAYGAMVRNRGMMRSVDLADNTMGWVKQYAEMNRLYGRTKMSADEFSALAAGTHGEGEIQTTLAQAYAMQTGANDPDRQKESDERVRAMISNTGEGGWAMEYKAKKGWSGAVSDMYGSDPYLGHATLGAGLMAGSKILGGGARWAGEKGTTALGKTLVRRGGAAAANAAGAGLTRSILARQGAGLAGKAALGAIARGAAVGWGVRIAAGAGLVAAGVVSAPVVAAASLAYGAYELWQASPAIADWAGNTWNKFSYGTQRNLGNGELTDEQNDARLAGYASELGAKDVDSLQRAFNVNRENMLGGGDGTSTYSALRRELAGMASTDPRRKETIRTMSGMGMFGAKLTEKDISNFDAGLLTGDSRMAQWAATRTGLNTNSAALSRQLENAKGPMAAYMVATDIRDERQIASMTKGVYSKTRSPEAFLEWYSSQASNMAKKAQELEISSNFENLGGALKGGAGSAELTALASRVFGDSVTKFGEYVRGLPGNSLTAGNEHLNSMASP